MPEYIEKQHLLEFFDFYIKEEEDKQAQMIAKNIKRAIKQMPSDNMVERKKGEWFDRGSLSCRCSNCGCKSIKEYSFCPNCGADMRGGKR